VPDDAAQHGAIEIFRDTNDDVQDRWIRVSIDGMPDDILRYGETLRREVPPGTHRIKANNTLSRDAIEVDVAAQRTVRIRCHNHFARGGILMMLAIGFAFIKVRLEVVEVV
jgi:hypothetical protein